MLLERALTNHNRKDAKNPERYTIFHALFEAVKEKDKKGKK